MVGHQLHPQSAAVAGGMTYRPQGGIAQCAEQGSHTPEVAGSSPAPAPTICPMPTKRGEECRGYPNTTGFCTGHANAVGHALKELLGA